MKETEEDTKKWKDTLCSYIRRINTIKMSIVPKATERLNAIRQNPNDIFHVNRIKNPKLYMETKIPEKPKQSSEKRTKLKVSHSQISNYITKLYSIQNSLALAEKQTHINGTKFKAQK